MKGCNKKYVSLHHTKNMYKKGVSKILIYIYVYIFAVVLETIRKVVRNDYANKKRSLLTFFNK